MATYHHGSLRSALVRSAIELIEERDVAGLTLRAVGRRVGVSRSAPYHHFRSREDLLAAVAVEGFRRLQKRLDDTAGGGEDSFHRHALEYVRFASTHPALFRVMHRPEVHQAPDASDLAEAVANLCRTWGRLTGSTDRGLTAWSALHGLAALWIDGPLRAAAAHRTLAQLVTATVSALR